VTAPLFLVATERLDDDPVVVDGAEGKHAADVRRLAVGEEVMVGDGFGRVVHGKVCEVARGRIAVAVERREQTPLTQPRFVVVQALAKAGRDEAAIEAMTEVGVDEVIGWEAARSIAKWTDRTSAKWQSTVREAAKQSRRAWVPVVDGPMSTGQVADRIRHASRAVVLEPRAETAIASVALPEDGDMIVVVGPEGGVAPAELSAFVEAGAAVGRLGDSVLRSSTAGVAALSVLSAMRRWR